MNSDATRVAGVGRRWLTSLMRVPAQSPMAALAAMVALLLLAAPAQGQKQQAVAVFNFQMKSQTPDWLWLEKGLADRLISDLFVGRHVAILQRDTMEQLAEQMKWTPELMTDPRQMAKVSFKAGHYISGTYEVSGDLLTITAQVVEAATSREVARRTVSGPLKEVLDLSQRLNVEVIAWLTQRRPEEIREALPAWTRSMPAARALYEGVHLYDQGRYGEAWLKFRQASRQDPQYVEAQYWVGKMYYFMGRYEHARSSYESFIYGAANHPRLGDAVMEYLHTYEKLNTPTDQLLELYQTLRQRYPLRDSGLDDEGRWSPKVAGPSRSTRGFRGGWPGSWKPRCGRRRPWRWPGPNWV